MVQAIKAHICTHLLLWLWFKYATWNVRGLGEKEEELDKILNESNIKISVITVEDIYSTKATEPENNIKRILKVINHAS